MGLSSLILFSEAGAGALAALGFLVVLIYAHDPVSEQQNSQTEEDWQFPVPEALLSWCLSPEDTLVRTRLREWASLDACSCESSWLLQHRCEC
jgi:hypothetical protein